MRYLLILCVFFFSQCSDQDNYLESEKAMGDNSYDMEEQMQSPRTAEAPPPPETELEKGSKIIKNGNLSFEVDDLKNSKSSVDTILKKLNGYYENEQFSSYGNQNNYSLKIRIPNLRFDTLILLLENGKGKLLDKTISAKDVTEEYMDLNIRLNNNLAYLNQYQEILKKAKSIKEILEVQEKIRSLEEEIDSKKGRIKFLNDKVQFSTVMLELSAYNEIEETGNSFFKSIKSAFQNGFQLLLNIIIGLVNLWPILFLIVLISLMRKNIFSFFKRKK
ncbi:MAG: hypothetical protein ACJAT4_002481 [Granulosicoccus sp.]|jgi:hypothetical protein